MTELSIFSWNEDNVEGFKGVTWGYFNDVNEIDFDVEDTKRLIKQLQERVDNGEGVSLRIEEEPQPITQKDLFHLLNEKYDFVLDNFGPNEEIHISNGYGRFVIIHNHHDDDDWSRGVDFGIESKGENYIRANVHYNSEDLLLQDIDEHLAVRKE